MTVPDALDDALWLPQVRSTLEQDVELLQQQLEQLKAVCLLNTEKLDYNYQVRRAKLTSPAQELCCCR